MPNTAFDINHTDNRIKFYMRNNVTDKTLWAKLFGELATYASKVVEDFTPEIGELVIADVELAETSFRTKYQEIFSAMPDHPMSRVIYVLKIMELLYSRREECDILDDILTFWDILLVDMEKYIHRYTDIYETIMSEINPDYSKYDLPINDLLDLFHNSCLELCKTLQNGCNWVFVFQKYHAAWIWHEALLFRFCED